MASADFLLLTDLLYNKGWSVKQVTHNYNGETGWKSTIVLTKENEIRDLESTADDFVIFAFQLQQTIDAKGERRLRKVRDADKYWSDIEALVDLDGVKTRTAT